MLGALGMDERSAVVCQLVLDRPGVAPADIAAETGLPPDQVVDALRTLDERLRWAECARAAVTDVLRRAQACAAALSDNERQVLALLVSGMKDETIARHIGVSLRTVRRMVADLMGRLGAQSRFQAGAAAARAGWLPLPAVDDPPERPADGETPPTG